MSPLLLKFVIDDGITRGRRDIVLALAVLILGVAVGAVATYAQTWASNRVGQGLLYDLRTTVFTHVQRQPLTFFTRAETGALISRLNSDVIGAQQAVTTLLSQTVSTLFTLVLVLGAMFYLSWQLTVAVLLLIPLALLPSKLVGRRLQHITRRRMTVEGEMASMMGERFRPGSPRPRRAQASSCFSAASATSAYSTILSSKTAASNSSRSAKRRRRVGSLTPACRAICRIDTSSPCSDNTFRAAATMRSRLRTASARSRPSLRPTMNAGYDTARGADGHDHHFDGEQQDDVPASSFYAGSSLPSRGVRLGQVTPLRCRAHTH